METEEYTNKKQWTSREIKEEIREYLETNENKNTIFQTMGLSKSSLEREVYRYKPTSRNKNNHNLTCHFKKLEKEEQIKPKDSRRKEIVKIRENK